MMELVQCPGIQKEQQPKVLYTHCASHRLNLCIVKSCSNHEVTNMMEVVDSMSHFFNNSPKRQLELEKWIAAVLPPVKTSDES